MKVRDRRAIQWAVVAGAVGLLAGGLIGAIFLGLLATVASMVIPRHVLGAEGKSHERRTERELFEVYEKVTILSGALAKAGGPVSEHEIRVFKRYFMIPNISEDQMAVWWQAGVSGASSWEDASHWLRDYWFARFNGRISLMLLHRTLCNIAMSKGEISPRQIVILEKCARTFGIGHSSRQSPFRVEADNIDEDLKILGVDRNTTPEQIKKQWRSLARKLHPDRMGHAPPEEAAAATARLAAVNAAYDRVSRFKGV